MSALALDTALHSIATGIDRKTELSRLKMVNDKEIIHYKSVKKLKPF